MTKKQERAFIKNCVELSKFCLEMKEKYDIDFDDSIKKLGEKLNMTFNAVKIAVKIGVDYQLNQEAK